MEHSGEIPNFEQEHKPEEEKVVEATKISTVFSDQKVLEKIADNLLSRGLISGFHIDRALSGYIYQGKKTEENQYSLEILLDDKTTEGVKNQIRETIAEVIGEKWDVPAIEEEQVRVNKELLGFIKRAEVEHQKYVHERRLKLTVALTALLSISATLGVFTKKHFEEKEHRAIAMERAESYKKINELEKKIDGQIMHLEITLAEKKELTPAQSEFGPTAFEETDDILQSVEQVKEEMQRLNREAEK